MHSCIHATHTRMCTHTHTNHTLSLLIFYNYIHTHTHKYISIYIKYITYKCYAFSKCYDLLIIILL